MSSIDDYANGAEQTRYHRNPPEECGRAVWLVCSYAHDADDARELCTVLGLNPRDGSRNETSGIPQSPVGHRSERPSAPSSRWPTGCQRSSANLMKHSHPIGEDQAMSKEDDNKHREKTPDGDKAPAGPINPDTIREPKPGKRGQ